MDTICVLTPRDAFIDKATSELKTHLDRMSGQSWTISYSDINGSAIRLYVNSVMIELLAHTDEAVRLTSNVAGISIVGKTSIAVRHGAYIFLEKLGIRWFFKHPAWTVIPTSLPDFGTFDEIQDPWFIRRQVEPAGYQGINDMLAWNKRNRMFGVNDYPVFHNYAAIIDHYNGWNSMTREQHEAVYTLHPTWFLPNNRYPSWPWQLNPDDPDVIAMAKKYARDLCANPSFGGVWGWEGGPQKCIPVSANDGGGFYPPWNQDTQQQIITDKVFGLADTVARDIAVDYPGMMVGVYCYAQYSLIPTIALSPNILVMVATDFNYGNLTIIQRIQGMIAKGCQFGIRDYVDIWTWYKDGPKVNLTLIQQVQLYAHYGVRFYDGEGSDGWGGRFGLMDYILSKVLWNPDVNINSILDDFYVKAFGPASNTMRAYYNTRAKDITSLAQSFYLLVQAKEEAAGYEDIIERIRQLEYYNRYLWKWHNVGIANLTLDDLKSFYTFVTKISNLYLLSYSATEPTIRDEFIKKRGLTDADVNALMNTTPPTIDEANTYMSEALAAMAQPPPPSPSEYINPFKIDLVPLSDITTPEVNEMSLAFGTILVQSLGHETINVMVKNGVAGYPVGLHWFHPSGLEIGSYGPGAIPDDWTEVSFDASDPGTYVLEVRRLENGYTHIKIPGHSAALLTDSRKITDYNSTTDRDAPGYNGSNTAYFYVPFNTPSFRFGGDGGNEGRNPHGALTSPIGEVYPFEWPEATEMTIEAPTPGLWKLDIAITTLSGLRFWFAGIPPLTWYSPKFLLIPKWHTLILNSTTGGTVRPEPGIYSTEPGTYSDGNTIVLLAIPNPDYRFIRWEENGTTYSTQNPLWVPCSEDSNLTPVFQYVPPSGTFNVTIESSLGGTTDPIPSVYNVTSGNELTIEAKPDKGYKFDHWEDIASTESLITVQVTSDMTIKAVFTALEPEPSTPTLNIVDMALAAAVIIMLTAIISKGGLKK